MFNTQVRKKRIRKSKMRVIPRRNPPQRITVISRRRILQRVRLLSAASYHHHSLIANIVYSKAKSIISVAKYPSSK